MYRGTSLCDEDFLVAMVVVVVDDGSVIGGTTVVSVVVGATVVVVDDAVVVVDAAVVVVAAAGVTVKPVEASSPVVLWTWTDAAPAWAAGGTETLPENDGAPWESATPIRVVTPALMKSMVMQLGPSAGQALKFVSMTVNWLLGAPWLGFVVICGEVWARAAEAESTADAAVTTMPAAMRRAGESVQSTGGGYVQAGAACYRSGSTALCPLGQKAKKSHRRHHGPAVVG